MKLKLTFLLIGVILFCTSTKAQKTEDDFLTKEQILALYDDMISEIERIDAEAIAVRNKTKQVSWNKYKKHHRKQFENIQTPADFKAKFNAFGQGFVCGHSHFDFLMKTNVKSNRIKCDIEIGYTYPKVTFFDLTTKQTIVKINGVATDKVFKDFNNYQTRTNGINDAARSFKLYFEYGKLKVNNKIPETIVFADGSIQKLNYQKPTQKRKTRKEIITKSIDVTEYEDWEVIAKGYKAALLQKGDVALIKIKNFKYKNSNYSIACVESADDSTMCADVQKVKEGLSSICKKVNYLIIDLQDNFGGHENSPFLKAFSPNAFYDLRVQYRKIALLEDDDLRMYLNYGSERAEKWYHAIRANGIWDQTNDGEFLPARADFCQGDTACSLKPIQPSDGLCSGFEKIIVLVNEGTASSADDFAYRMKEQDNVLVAGQPQSADLTYSLITLFYYLDKNGAVKKKFIGNWQDTDNIEGVPLLKFDIPYSRTVNKNGEMLQGNPLKLDLEVPITKDNFEKRNQATLNQVVERLILQKQ